MAGVIKNTWRLAATRVQFLPVGPHDKGSVVNGSEKQGKQAHWLDPLLARRLFFGPGISQGEQLCQRHLEAGQKVRCINLIFTNYTFHKLASPSDKNGHDALEAIDDPVL